MLFRKKQKSIENAMNIQVVFYKQASAFELTGRIFVDSKIYGLKNAVVDFSIIQSGRKEKLDLTPGLLSIIFEQAKAAGFKPISLISYEDHDIQTGYAVFNRSSVKAPNRVTLASDVPSIGLVEVRDIRNNRVFSSKLCCAELSERPTALTPKLLELIFESFKEHGVIPFNLLSFIPHPEEKYLSYIEQQALEESKNREVLTPNHTFDGSYATNYLRTELGVINTAVTSESEESTDISFESGKIITEKALEEEDSKDRILAGGGGGLAQTAPCVIRNPRKPAA